MEDLGSSQDTRAPQALPLGVISRADAAIYEAQAAVGKTPREDFDVKDFVSNIVNRAAAKASPKPTPREEQAAAAAASSSSAGQPPRAMPSLPARKPATRLGGFTGECASLSSDLHPAILSRGRAPDEKNQDLKGRRGCPIPPDPPTLRALLSLSVEGCLLCPDVLAPPDSIEPASWSRPTESPAAPPCSVHAAPAREEAPAAAASSSSSSAPAPAAPSTAATGAMVDPEEPSSVTKKREELHALRVRLLRAMTRIGSTSANIGQQVLYRLDASEQHALPPLKAGGILAALKTGPGSERATRAENDARSAEQRDAEEPIMSITVLCVGLVGSGKTATINSILGTQERTSAFGDGTRGIRAVKGKAFGIDWTFVDTPGLYPTVSEKARNEALLRRIKGAMGKYKPDTVVYFDRLDNPRRDNADLGVIKSICDVLGTGVLYNSLIVFTHAGTAPPEGTRGPLAYDEYLTQRQGMVHQAVRLASQESRLNPMVCPVENHANCRRNNRGEAVLPNDLVWRPHMLSLLVGYKALRDGDNILRLREKAKPQNQNQLLAMLGLGGAKMPPLPYLLQQLMAARQPRKAPEDEREIRSERELDRMDDDSSAKKEAVIKRKEFIRQRAEEARQAAEGAGSDASVLAPEPPLPPSFDPTETVLHRYRYIENQAGWIMRPQVQQQTVDHDDGIEGVIVERNMMLRPRGQHVGGVPFYCNAIMQKDKSASTFQGEAEATVGLDLVPGLGEAALLERTKLTSGLAALTLGGQTGGSDMLYVLRSETRTKGILRERNKLVLGLQMSKMSEGLMPLKGPWTYGAKVEDRIKLGEGMKASVGFGLCSARSGAMRQSAKSLQAEIKRKTDKNSQTSAQGRWFCPPPFSCRALVLHLRIHRGRRAANPA